MSDNTFGYSNNGLTQSLNGITSITDGSGASITDGNAIFIDTTTNTATINNNLTIPLSSLLTLYGNIFLPDYNITLTPNDISAIGNLSGITTRLTNVETKTNDISYDLPSDTTTLTGNTIFGTSGALATYTTMRINSDINLYGNLNLPNFSSVITPTTLNNMLNIINNLNWNSTSSYINTNNLINLGVNGNLYLYPSCYIIQGTPGAYTSTLATNLKNLPYLDATSSIQTQFNNITTNYLTKSLAASTYLTQTNAASTYATIASLANYLTTSAAASTYLTQTSAASTYLSQSNAASTYLTQSNAASTYLTQTNAASTYATLTALNNYLTTTLAASTYLTQTNAASTYVTQSALTTTLFNFISVTALNIILSNYAKLSNNNIFTNNQNIYKNIYIDDTSFNDINYMQLVLSSDGSVNGSNSVVGIDFTTWSGRDGASARIYGLDNGNYSAHLVFATASPGPAQNPSMERMRIQDDGNIGIGTQTPGYLLDVNGTMNATTISENGTLLSSKYAAITGNIATATRATNVSVTADNTTTNLCIALTTASATTASVGLRVDSNLRFNASTNALTTSTFIGNLTGNCSGSSSSCTGNAATATTAGTCTGNSATATTSTSIGITEDTTSIEAYIPFTLLSTTISNAFLKISSYLGYNPSTNTLSCNHRGSVTVQSGANLQLQPGATSNICPIGCILMMAQQTSFSGWLVCNGTSYSTVTYAGLFAVIGYTYGGSGSFFKVPDFQGAFLRGFSSPTTPRNLSYASNAFGEYQESQIGSHGHSLAVSNNGVNTNIGTAFVGTGINPQTNTTTETRPYNYCVQYYIKY